MSRKVRKQVERRKKESLTGTKSTPGAGADDVDDGDDDDVDGKQQDESQKYDVSGDYDDYYDDEVDETGVMEESLAMPEFEATNFFNINTLGDMSLLDTGTTEWLAGNSSFESKKMRSPAKSSRQSQLSTAAATTATERSSPAEPDEFDLSSDSSFDNDDAFNVDDVSSQRVLRTRKTLQTTPEVDVSDIEGYDGMDVDDYVIEGNHDSDADPEFDPNSDYQ